MQKALESGELAEKRVRWCQKLTNVKIMTPQSSVFDIFKGAVFMEEEEGEGEEEEGLKKHPSILQQECEKSRRLLKS